MISLGAWKSTSWSTNHHMTEETNSAMSSILYLLAPALAWWVHRSPWGRRKRMLKFDLKKHILWGSNGSFPGLPGRSAEWRTSSRASTSHMAYSRSCPQCSDKTFRLLWHKGRRTKKKCVCINVEIITTRTKPYGVKERESWLNRESYHRKWGR